MSLLRPSYYPTFGVVEEVVDFADQVLEVRCLSTRARFGRFVPLLTVFQGLAFMHSHCVAHRSVSPSFCDITANAPYAQGLFPQKYTDGCLTHVSAWVSPCDEYFSAPRYLGPCSYDPSLGRESQVLYYFTDYGILSYFPEGTEPHLVLGLAGRDRDVPELSDEVPYDPFKVDIFTIGNVLRREFVGLSSGFLFQSDMSISPVPRITPI